jgi:hypothetical protein
MIFLICLTSIINHSVCARSHSSLFFRFPGRTTLAQACCLSVVLSFSWWFPGGGFIFSHSVGRDVFPVGVSVSA